MMNENHSTFKTKIKSYKRFLQNKFAGYAFITLLIGPLESFAQNLNHVRTRLSYRIYGMSWSIRDVIILGLDPLGCVDSLLL